MDDNATIVGVNGNGNYLGTEEIHIKKSPAGASGCTVVKFTPGYGNIPLNTTGSEIIKRIFATSLTAYSLKQPVSILIGDTTNCYGIMLVFTDTSGF